MTSIRLAGMTVESEGEGPPVVMLHGPDPLAVIWSDGWLGDAGLQQAKRAAAQLARKQ
jgi:hypothetical protein